MNLLNATSQHEELLGSSIKQWARNKTGFFVAVLIVLSCLTFSPAWAGDYSHNQKSVASIQLTGLSLYVGPGGVHLGLRVPSYGRYYGRPHLHPFAKRYWKHQKHDQYRHGYGSSKRFKHRHGWKNERPRGKFRGKHSHRRHRH